MSNCRSTQLCCNGGSDRRSQTTTKATSWYALLPKTSRHFITFYLYILFDQRRVDVIDQVEYGVHGRSHIYPMCGIVHFPWHRHQIEETDDFQCLFRKILAKCGKGNSQKFPSGASGILTRDHLIVTLNHHTPALVGRAAV